MSDENRIENEENVDYDQYAETDDAPFEPLSANHALLAPVQEALAAQFRKLNEQKYLEIKEKNEILKKINANREDKGVQLYGVQQHLAKLQERLEQSNNLYNTIAAQREEIDKRKEELEKMLRNRKEEIDRQAQEIRKYKSDLDKIAASVRQAKLFGEMLKGDIKTKRTGAYKLEDQMNTIEGQKKLQDFLIDNLTARLQRLREDAALYESQLEAQREETRIAAETLADATAEMEAITFEKNQLWNQWKSSLIGMQRRDAALRATEDALKKQREKMLEIQNEIEGYQIQIQTEKEKHELLTQNLKKLNKEKKYLEQQIEQTQETLDNMHQSYQRYTQTLERTEAQLELSKKEGKAIEREKQAIDQYIVKVAEEIKRIEDENLQVLSQQVTAKKGEQSAITEIQKITNKVRDKEMEIAQVENELARIKIDKIQKENHNTKLQEMLKDLENEMKRNEQLIEKYEVEIRRKHDEIEKKQQNLDRLNRIYDKLMSEQEEENSGPLEATIKNLKKAVAQKQKENEQLKRDWTRHQSELVNYANTLQELSKEITQIKAKLTVLNQKKLRLEGSAKYEEQDIKELQNDMKKLRFDMGRINEAINKNEKVKEFLANSNYDLENQILDKLKREKLKSIQIEENINEIKANKRQILNSIIECERQILYWERKLEIQKEIQDALDPNVGREEIEKMKREIHIMEQRVVELRRSQKQKIEAMMQSISKRELIFKKGESVEKNKRLGITKANVQRDIQFLTKEINKKRKENAKRIEAIRKIQKDTEQAIEEEEKTKQEIVQSTQIAETLRMEIQKLNLEQSILKRTKDRIKRVGEKFRDAKQGKYKLTTKQIETAKEEIEDKQKRILQLLEKMKLEFQHMGPAIDLIIKSLIDQ